MELVNITDISQNKYTTKLSNYCLTGSIRNQMSALRVNILESDLICCDNMLNTEYDLSLGGITSPIKWFIDQNCSRLGIRLIRYTAHQREQIVSALAAKQRVILHIDSRCLTYSPLFKTKITVHTNHYINLLGLDGSQLYISDSYIPTLPPSTYEGTIGVSEDYINKSTVFILEQVNVKQLTENERKNCIEQSIKNYLYPNSIGIDHYNRLANDVSSVMNGESVAEVKSIMMEMASCLVVSGLYASRILFLETILHSNLPDEKKTVANRQFTELSTMYMSLKLLLTKCSFSNRKADYLSVLHRLQAIKELETDALKNLI
ncbi:hypothetical protein [Paenibacillus sp. GCM10012306]|uniref:hypothetical protein n=1 Tax=Paenibacillus sp. GCM10012306 TaxID=3317342 RepID=UPI0036148992